MAPSSFKKLWAAFAIASAGKVAANTYTLTDEYTADNFFEKFDFYVTATDGADPTNGFVNYRAQADAESLGLISSSDGKIYIGPDSNQTYSSTSTGRDSVRIMSKAKYNQGLMVAKFSHMPVQSCGSWPAFWSYGSPWLSSGEIDYYEGWNDLGSNVMALHTNTTIAGQCLLTTSGVSAEVTTQDCDDQKVDHSINQYVGTGCGVSDTAGVWSSTDGATFAMQWADDHIKIWNWMPSKVPADITAGSPDPDANSDSWGQPQLLVEESNCDLASAFSNQQLVFNIDFCGDTAGNSVLWANTCSAMGDSCVDYVSSTPEAFAETYFEIEGIQFYELGSGSASVSASASASVVAATSEAVTSATSSASGLLAGAGSVLASTFGVSATIDLDGPIAATSTHSHTTSYITGTATRVNEKGETTVVVEVDTTICPVTASEASESSVLAAASTPVPAQTTATSETAAIATTPVAAPSTHSHTTSYITGTSTKVNEKGETTVVIEVDTTICPVTASEASESSVLAAASTPVPAQTTATSETAAVGTTPAASVPVAASTIVSTTLIDSTSILTQMTTSTVYATHTSTISSCAPGASGCAIGDVSTVVVALSTTICPVTAAEASQSANASTLVVPASVKLEASTSAAPLAAGSSSVSRAASSRTAAAYTSVPLAAQSTFSSKPTTISRVTRTAPAGTTVLAAQTSEAALEMATGTTSADSSVTYGDATETLAVPSATYSSYPGGNGTAPGAAGTTSAGAAGASATSSCAGIDCIVVSNSASKSTVGAGGFALAAIAGAVFLL